MSKKSKLIFCVTSIVCVALGLYSAFLLSRPPSEPVFKDVSSSKTAAWSIWYVEHSKTCEQCGNHDESMCVEAFDKLQESLRK